MKHETQALKAPTRTVERRRRWWRGIACGMVLLSLLSLGLPAGQAADFACAAGNVACLIDAINQANANGKTNTITLDAGTYTLTAVENTTEGSNGLPSVTSTLTMQGAGADTTTIERSDTAPEFRLLHVATTGRLTLKRLTLRGGEDFSGFSLGGGGVANRGSLILTQSSVVSNTALFGGGIDNVGGTVTITHSTFRDNLADAGGGIANGDGAVTITDSTLVENSAGHDGGGFANYGGMVTITRSTIAGSRAAGPSAFFNFEGTVIISDSTIADNGGDPFNGMGIGNRGFLTILNSTIARNFGGIVAGIFNDGQLFIINSTIADNFRTSPFGGEDHGGIATGGTGSTVLLNTILARNKGDCGGPVTSLGTNLIGDPTGCTLTLQPTDLTGDPGLDAFTNDGTPGNGHFPLLPTSQAIDTGNDAVCPRTDQLGQRRVDIPGVGTSRCDIGAIEFPGQGNRPHDEDRAAVVQQQEREAAVAARLERLEAAAARAATLASH